MSTQLGSSEISPVPVPARDASADIESAVPNPATFPEELVIYVKIVENSDDSDSEDDDSEDNDSEDGESDDEEVRNVIVKLIKVTVASKEQDEGPESSEAQAENQESEEDTFFLLMVIPCSDTDTPDEDSEDQTMLKQFRTLGSLR